MVTRFTFIKELTGIGRHRLQFLSSTIRASNSRLQLYRIHLCIFVT